MKLSYIRDMAHNYMIPENGEQIDKDDYRIHMLTENRIAGLLPCTVKMRDGKNCFYYDITSRQSLEHIYGRGSMGEEEILALLKGLYRTLKEIKKYLLDAAMVILEPQMIYMDIETKEPFFCYLPGYHKEITRSFQELTAYVLEHISQSDERAVLMGYDIYRKAREENYSLEKILKAAGEEKRLFKETGMPAIQEKKPDWNRYGVKELDLSVYEPKEPGWHTEKEKGQARHTGEVKGTVRHTEKIKGPAGNMHGAEKTVWSANETKERGKKEKKEKKSGKTFLVMSVVFSALLFGAAAVLWDLDTVQIGGIIFFLAAVLIYGCAADRKGKKKKAGKKESAVKEQDMPYMVREQPYIYPDLNERKEGRQAEGKREKQKVQRRFGNTGVLPSREDIDMELTLVSMNADLQKTIGLTEEQYVVGKLASQADIVLDHHSVSRIHAKIQREQENYYLYDLNSTNGTFHNGRRLGVNEKVPLCEGDEIAFARVGFYVEERETDMEQFSLLQ